VMVNEESVSLEQLIQLLFEEKKEIDRMREDDL
jgi:hypothetical protein